MGIPSYYKNIIDNFPSTIYSQKNHHVINNRVFLDFNCGIHQCSNNIKKNINEFTDHQTFENLLIQETLNYIDEIYNFTKPTNLLYISIDGIPSRSKMIQQRTRRFNGMWKKNKTLEILSTMNNNSDAHLLYNKIYHEWSSDNISPGTIFMKTMCDAIRKHILQYPIKCILSDYDEMGEGEYKIVQYIKKNPCIKKPVDIIYGLDADLIMLSLIIENSSIYLLREPVFFDTNNNDNFLYFNIDLLRNKLLLSLNTLYNIKENDTFILIHTYVFLCIFLGNDFLPNLSYIDIKNNGIDIILQKYSLLFNKFQKHIINYDNNEWSIDYYILSQFMKILAQNEDNLFIDYDQSYYNYNNNRYFQQHNSKEIIKIIDFQINNQFEKFTDIIKPSQPKWRQRYYYYLFGDNNGDHIQKICLNYSEGIQWILNYYFNHKYHLTWYYQYNYSPTILDFSNYLQIMITKNINNIIYDNNIYPDILISTDLQLLMIMPKESYNLLKPEYRNIINDINFGFIHFYPLNTAFNTYLKKNTWQFIPQLPEFDIIEIFEKIENINKVENSHSFITSK
jgi:5'-3' exonuclease